MIDTLPLLEKIAFPAISRKKIDVLQLNLGYRCNQQCLHCHVNAGPNRQEEMSVEVLQQIISFVKENRIKCVDLTGGAPEMHADFVFLIKSLHELGIAVIDRCNLTVLNESGYEHIAKLLADNQVQIVASMPCYLEENVNNQRGKGVFESSIKALRMLNELGYGVENSHLILNLVYNPQGASLSPEQIQLEYDYKQLLSREYGIVFNQLYTITNVPVKRFGSMLISKNEFDPYMKLLQDAYQPENLDSVMCRHQVSIDWQGYLYDCDFNQMLNLPLLDNDTAMQNNRLHISQVTAGDLQSRDIIVAGHCYACTAGQGSSCGGALS
ncbi:MAG: arsenosugar biosynthesis radical SAM protein ArsS [gamma proteobacterium symbiont of Taylorina sp.]|nr:arsenosugar biosynthesis radical SAM protein ArsS [gamma proteobacterium symbiont of Taylorina sp.]